MSKTPPDDIEAFLKAVGEAADRYIPERAMAVTAVHPETGKGSHAFHRCSCGHMDAALALSVSDMIDVMTGQAAADHASRKH